VDDNSLEIDKQPVHRLKLRLNLAKLRFISLLRIRLKRIGRKKQPAYRIVVADSRSPRDGRPVEEIGHYDPLTNPPEVVINGERALYWIGQGAQPSDAVSRILVRQGLQQGETVSS
jgi:small subunit ribosomal protein S16